MLQVHNLTAGYGPLTVLSDVSLSLADGARLGIFGHNGAGKTTLLRCIVGAVRPRAGKVDLDGADTGVGARPPDGDGRAVPRAGGGYLSSFFGLFSLLKTSSILNLPSPLSS